MPRPSLKAKRTLEILEAFERCVARVGLDAASAEMIAAEAGVKRTALRHFVGNRDALVRALCDHVMQRYSRQTAEMLAWLPAQDPIEPLFAMLFPEPSQARSFDDVVVFEAFIAASSRNEYIREAVAGCIEELVQAVATVLATEIPDRTQEAYWSCAYGITALYFNHDSLSVLGLPPRYTSAARTSARQLVEGLRHDA